MACLAFVIASPVHRTNLNNRVTGRARIRDSDSGRLYRTEASRCFHSGRFALSMYDLEEDRLIAEITGRGARRLLIQLPDGLKSEGPRLASLIRETTRFLESKGFRVQHPGRGPWAHETGQVLGCDYFGLKRIEPETDSFLVIGSYFHALGASLSVQKPTILADPYDGTVRLLDQDRAKIIRQRYAMVEKARQANNFGIIVSTKPGQSNPTIALNIQHQLEENGKKAVILYADEVVPDKLLDFTDIEAFVDTACPRLALGDPERFSKPIVSRDEIMVVMGAWTWEQLLERGLVRL